MPLTPNIGLIRPPHGDYNNTWDQPVNQNWDIVDGLFSGSAPPGHTHAGTAGMGPKVDHADLLTIGIKTHAQLDAVFGKAMVSATDTTPDYLELKVVAGSGITINKLGSPGNESLEIEATGGFTWIPDDEYGDKHAVPTSAPVAYTDNFTYPPGFTLRQADYAVDRSTPSTIGLPDFLATGYSSVLYVDPGRGDDPVGKYAATVACQIPHGAAQRVTTSITDINYDDMVVGDYVAFTMSLFSTHRLGLALPQKYGVLLELHLVCLSRSPDVFQITHRILILPDASTQVLLFQCHNHTTPDDMKGAWELSLDSNGHVYHYWRRKLVYSSQTSPLSMPGPVQAYFPTLMASLVADGDEKYGAMGFGCHYGISALSKFNLEFRWFTVTSNADIYDEIPTCPGVADPYGIVTTYEVPKEFVLVPSVIPGDECCPSGPARMVGDILSTDPLGYPLIWVTSSCELQSDTGTDGIEKGYNTNTSPHCFPCPSPSIGPEGLTIFDLTGTWPMEGTEGKIVIHGLRNLPPEVEAFVFPLLPNPYFHVIDAVWLDYEELELKYTIDDGGGGTSFSIEIRSPVDHYRRLVIPNFVTFQTKDPEITSIDWLDSYIYGLSDPTAGYRFNATIHGSGFKPATTLTTATAGVTINSYTVDGPGQITADITFGFAARGALFTLDVGVASFTDDVEHPVPILSYIDFGPPPAGPDIGVGKTLSIYGNFFAGMPPLMNIVPVDPLLVANFAVVNVTTTKIDVTFDIIGAPGSLIEVLVQNVDSGFSVTVPVCVINDSTVLTTGAPLGTTPSPVYCAGREPGPEGYPPFSYEPVVPAGMNGSVYTLLSGPAVGPLYVTAGDAHTINRSPISVRGQFWNACGENMLVDVIVIKPGVNTVLIPGAFSMADPIAPVPNGSPTFSTPPVPGATGTVDFLFSAGLDYLTDVESVTTPGITFTGRSTIVGGLRYNFTIASTVAPLTPTAVNFGNGPCGAGFGTHNFTTEYAAPVITSVELDLHEDITGNVGTIRGTGFVVGTSIIVGGNITYVTHTDVDSETIQVTVNNGAPGAATIQVQNPDTKLSNVFPLTLVVEEVPDVDHVDLVPSTEGVSATLYIYGDNLYPPGAGYAYSGFVPSGPPTYINDSYIEIDGTITAVAGGDIEVTITSTSHAYPPIFLAKATASPGGTVVIDSIDNRFPKDNQLGFTTTIFGQNLDQVDSVVVIPSDPDRLALQYQPAGPDVAVTAVILGKTVDHVTLSLDLKKGLAFNEFDFNLYDPFLVLLATAPDAIKTQPSDNAPEISEATRLLLDAAIPTVAGAGPWTVVFPVGSYLFGDEVLATGFTLVGVPTYLGGQWTVTGINAAVPGTEWEMKINRPGVPPPTGPEWSVYRIPGGVTT